MGWLGHMPALVHCCTGLPTLVQRERCWYMFLTSWGASPMARYSCTYLQPGQK